MQTRCWQRTMVAVVGATLGLARLAAADVTTERSGSILVFPKVIATGTRDTVIQIANTSNSLVHAHCFYVNAALQDPTQPQGSQNLPLWQEIDFDITLTKQQPTHWLVSQGREVNPFDYVCVGGGMTPGFACSGAGIDPGHIPPVVPDFEGELKCVEVDDSGAPLSGNHLKGEATVVFSSLEQIATNGTVQQPTGDMSKYNALAIAGSENNGDGTLVLGGGQCVGDGAARGAVCSSDGDCADAAPCAPEYNACPQTWILNHAADGAPDLVLEDAGGNGPTSIQTELTVVPCTENFETQEPTAVTLQFLTFNEFESQFSVSTTVVCWGNFLLGDIGATALTFAGQQVPDPQGSMYLQTRIRSATGSPLGVLMVAEELHVAKTSTYTAGTDPTVEFRLASAAAANLHVEGERATPDVITIPDDQLTR